MQVPPPLPFGLLVKLFASLDLRGADDDMIIMFQRCYVRKPLFGLSLSPAKNGSLTIFFFDTPGDPNAGIWIIFLLFLFLLSLLLPHTTSNTNDTFNFFFLLNPRHRTMNHPILSSPTFLFFPRPIPVFYLSGPLLLLLLLHLHLPCLIHLNSSLDTHRQWPTHKNSLLHQCVRPTTLETSYILTFCLFCGLSLFHCMSGRVSTATFIPIPLSSITLPSPSSHAADQISQFFFIYPT